MKLFRSKSIAVQRKALGLAITRVRKVHNEIRELSMRDWKGGEVPIATDVNKTRDKLDEALETLKEAERGLVELQKAAERKGK